MIGHHDPWNIPRRVASHLHNAVESLIDGPGMLAWIVLVVAVLGVVAMALRGSEVIVGRFLALCLAVAVLGSIGNVLPMGSALENLGRLNLWLFPILAVGFAHAVQAVAASPRFRLEVVAPALGAVLAVALGWRALQVEVTYPPFGHRPAADQVLGELGVDDVIWISRFQTYGFALEPDLEVEIVRQTERNVGFTFRFDDPRIVGTSYGTTDAELVASLGPDVERVRVVTMDFLGDGVNQRRFADLLTRSGFALVEEGPVGGSVVSTWAREGA